MQGGAQTKQYGENRLPSRVGRKLRGVIRKKETLSTDGKGKVVVGFIVACTISGKKLQRGGVFGQLKIKNWGM